MIVFVDTSAWIALLVRNDQYHSAALAIQSRLEKEKAQLLTSDYVVDETVTWLRYRIGHLAAVAFWETTLRSKLIDIASINRELLDRSWTIFRKYADQQFSLTDCTSFALMQSRHVRRVFTFDSHFAFMGFDLET
jgi:uncharacterized protein